MPSARRASRELWGTSRAIVLAVGVALSIRCFLFEVFQIPSGSMLPTLQVGDRILVNKLTYGPRLPFTGIRLWHIAPPARGEVAVFIPPGTFGSANFIKRIIALPGDTVEVRAGRVLVNDEALPRIPLGPMTVSNRNDDTGAWGPLAVDGYIERFDPAHPSRGGLDAPQVGEGFTVLVDRDQSKGAYDRPVTRVPEGHVFVMGDNRWHSSDSRVFGCVPMGSLLGRATFHLFSWGEHGPDLSRSGRRVHRPVLP